MPKEKTWTAADIPRQDGKVAIVTGATGGLGYQTALRLAEAGAKVIVAGRNEAKGVEAVNKLKEALPNANVVFGKIDLGSLASVKDFAENFLKEHDALDILVNNAGIMTPPKRETTADGFEIQFGTNHLSHFALTAYLLPALRKSTKGPRVVNVSSGAAQQGKINFDDLQAEKCYQPWLVYAQSKLANLLFTSELQRKSDEKEWGLMVNAAHPGFSRTDLIANGPGNDSFMTKVANCLIKPYFSQAAEDGVLPQLFAATSPDAEKFVFYGPQGLFELKGAVGHASVPSKAKNEDTAKRLWEVSEALTQVTWP